VKETTNFCTYTPQNRVKEITKSLNSGFYVIASSDTTKIYTGNAGYKGIGILTIKDFLKSNYQWNYIDSSKGLNLVNVITIAEDNYHRLWFGRNSQGWGVYYPDADKAETFLIEKKQTDFGIMSSVLDKNGWIWMGGSKGLRYCNATKKGKINNADIKQFIHPLLTNGVVIAALKVWKHYLVIGIGKKLLLLDLNKISPASDK